MSTKHLEITRHLKIVCSEELEKEVKHLFSVMAVANARKELKRQAQKSDMKIGFYNTTTQTQSENI